MLTKPSDVEELCQKYPEREGTLRRAYDLSARADALYALALPVAAPAGQWMSSKPFLPLGVDENQNL